MLNFLKQIFAERRCAYCRKPYFMHEANHYCLCPACTKEIQRTKRGYCIQCGTIQVEALKNRFITSCEICAKRPVKWDGVYFFSSYEGILRELIQHAKFYGNILYLRILAKLLTEIIEEIPPFDFILPMPLHPKRLKERGYNQCLEIVKYICKYTHTKYNLCALEKKLYTVPQSSLSLQKRKRNLVNSFSVEKKEVHNKSIVLFDDVSTTGTTLRTVTKILRENGAKNIYILYIAGVPLKKKE